MKYKSVGIVLLAAIASACNTNNHPGSANQQNKAEDTLHPDAPLTANTRFAAGQVAESQGDLPRAAAQYKEAIKLDPKAPAPLLRLGMVYANLKQYDDAVEVWNRYIKLTNGAAAGYSDLGLTQELAGRFKPAEEAYKTALQKDPTNETAHVNYGLMLARLDRTPEAIAQLQTVLTPAEVHYNLASVLESQDKIKEAKDEYQEALRLDPRMNDAKARLAALDSD